MRLLSVSLALFLMTATLEAQRGGGGFQRGGGFRNAPPMARPGVTNPVVRPGFRLDPAVRPPFRSFPRRSVGIAPQVPFYGYPYYPDYSQPGYSQPYYPDPYYSQPAYSTPDQSSNGDQTINDLTDQVQRLTDEVQQLQEQLAATQAQQLQPSSLQVSPSAPERPVILVFRDGHQMETQGYAIAEQTLWIVGQAGTRKVPLSDLNLDATRKENLKRGINFLTPSS
jgi:hypothetical protein